jgi:uncharacterized membrane protein YdbT with pleckstrin-like domain
MIRSMNEEQSLWKGSPSQWLNLWRFAGALFVSGGILVGAVLSGPFLPFVLIALILPLAYAVFRYLVVRSQVFELTSERLRITSGIINQTINEIELYRVKDSIMTRPWWMRLTGLASIELETSDRSTPQLTIPAVHGGVDLREKLRRSVEIQRDRKRVRETDFDEVGGDHDGDLP